MWKNIVVSGLVMTSLLLLPLMAAAGGHHGGGHGPRGYRNVDQWLQSLPEEQQVKARAILEEARPAIEDTRWRIRQKREELAHFDYAEDSSAETLSPSWLGAAGPARPSAPAAGAAGRPPAGRGGREFPPRRQEPGLQQHDPAGRDPYVFPAGDPRTLPVTSAARMKHPGPAQAGLFLYPAPALGAGRQGCMKICLLYNF